MCGKHCIMHYYVDVLEVCLTYLCRGDASRRGGEVCTQSPHL